MTTIKLTDGTELHPTDDELVTFNERYKEDDAWLWVNSHFVRVRDIYYVHVPEEEKQEASDSPEAKAARMRRLRNYQKEKKL